VSNPDVPTGRIADEARALDVLGACSSKPAFSMSSAGVASIIDLMIPGATRVTAQNRRSDLRAASNGSPGADEFSFGIAPSDRCSI
jgi:hypothetical protein